MNKIGYVSLGSNIGDRLSNLKTAIEMLNSTCHVKVISKSSLYTTAPVGYLEQEDFMNAVVCVETSLEPMEMLKVCQTVETNLKRERIIYWGPRTIDLDILWFENFTSDSEVLTVPHPRMLERAFVMVPLSEINPELVIRDKTAREWCGLLTDQEVRKMTHEEW